MKSQEINRVRGTSWVGILVGSVLLAGIAGAQNKPVTGAMLGVIFGSDMKTPVEKAVVKLRNMKDGTELTCTPTDKDGIFNLDGIGEGRYLLGVSTGEGDYNFDYSVILKGRETAMLSLALKPRNGGVAAEGFGKLQPMPDIRDSDGFFRDPEGGAVVGSEDGAAVISCIGHRRPPKPPKSQHRPHH